MARHTLLFYFLQFLPLLASANAGFNGTIADCIDFDLANVEDLISTLRTVKNPEIKAFGVVDEDKEKNHPFGNLKTDWSRLQLLQEALPTNSLLKEKFKHIFRLLLIAHDQARRRLDLSESTKIQDAVEKHIPISLSNKNHKDAEEVTKKPVAEKEDFNSKSKKIGAQFINISTEPTLVIDEDLIDTNTSSNFYGLGTTYAKSTADDEEEVEMKGMTEASAELGAAKKINMNINPTDLNPAMNSLTTIAALIPTLEPMKSSTAGSILIVDTTISEEGITISTSIHEEPKQSTASSSSESTSAEEEVISMEKTTKIILEMKNSSPFEEHTASTTESILKEIYELSPDNAENSVFHTITNIANTEIQSLNWSFSENSLLSTTEQLRSSSSLQPAIKMDPIVESLITEEYPSPATVSSIVLTKAPPSVLLSSDKLPTSSLQKIGNISSVESIFGKTQTESTLQSENYSSNTELYSKIRDFGSLDTTKDVTTGDKSIGSSTVEENKEIELGISNKGTKNVSSPNLTSNMWTTDSAVNISNITPMLEDSEVKSTTHENQNEGSMSEKSILKVLSTIDSIEDVSATRNPMEKISDAPIMLENDGNSKITSSNDATENSTDYVEWMSNFTPTIETNEDNKLARQNDRTEAPIKEKSTVNSSATNSAMETTWNVPIENEQNGKGGTTNLDNETEKLMHGNMSSKNWYSTDSIESTSNVPFKVNENDSKKLKNLTNQIETLMSENSTINIKETINPSNHSTVVTPSIDNENINITNKNYQKEIPVSEKSTSSELSDKDVTESVKITTRTLTMNEKMKSTTQNIESTVSINDKSIYNDNDVPNTSQSAVALNTPNLFTNTVQLFTGTSVPHHSYKTTQYFVSMEPSIKAQEAESSTRNYVSEQSTIITNKIGINIPTDSELTNQTEVSKADLTTENAINNQTDLEHPSKESEYITNVTEIPEPRSDSETWRTNSKPLFVKNPLNTGSSRSNKIFQDFKHGSDDTEPDKNAESPQIVLYETGAGAKTGSVWRPHLVRQQPTGNKIWRFDSFPNNVGPYGYGYKQPAAPSVDSKADIRKDEKNHAKFPGQGNRMNLLRSRKRGSANSDVAKQFRWFYRHGRTDTAHESRVKENDNTKIKIQCKKAHQH